MSCLTLQTTLRAHTGPVWSVQWSARGLLATCGADRKVHVWTRLANNKWSLVVTSPVDTFLRAVRDIAWSSDGRSLAVASFDATTTVLELTGGSIPNLEAAVCLEGHEAEVKSLCYSSTGALLATCSRDRSVWIWEVGLDFDYECVAVLNSHRGDVKRVVWHPHIEMLLSCSYDQTIRVWVEDADDWFCSEELMAHSATVWDVSFDDDGEAIASVSADGDLVIWRREPPPPNIVGAAPRFVVAARVEALRPEPLYCVSWCPGRDLLAVGGGDDSIHVLGKISATEDDVQSIELAETASDCNDVGSPSHQPNGDATTRLTEQWEIKCSEKRGHDGDVNCVSWSPQDPKILASCGDDGLIRIWRYDRDYLPA